MTGTSYGLAMITGMCAIITIIFTLITGGDIPSAGETRSTDPTEMQIASSTATEDIQKDEELAVEKKAKKKKKASAKKKMEKAETTETESPDSEEEEEPAEETSSFKYSASYFMQMGELYDDEWRYTWYSENVLPGGGLDIPGRHLDDEGYVVDSEGRLVAASEDLPYGTVIEVPFGSGTAVVRDCGCPYGTIDIYVGW